MKTSTINHGRIEKNRQKRFLARALFSSLVLVFMLFHAKGCGWPGAILVGFSGPLTGRYSNMGVFGRDGALLAVDEINESGGIAGKKVELIVTDDLGTSEGALRADRELIEMGVAAIVGHMTSSQTLAAMPLVEKAGVALVSPTASTPELTGKVDRFFRVIPDCSILARLLARQAAELTGLRRVGVIFDESNKEYASMFTKAFGGELARAGAELSPSFAFVSGENIDFDSFFEEMRQKNPNGLLIVASAYDAAIIAQKTRIEGWDVPLFCAGWAMTSLFIENGGKAVEGAKFVSGFDHKSQRSEFIEFQKRFKARFDEKPDVMAATSYEALHILAAALEKTGGKAEGLAEALPGTSIRGTHSPVSLDEFGDGVRSHYLIAVKNGQFVTEDTLSQ